MNIALKHTESQRTLMDLPFTLVNEYELLECPNCKKVCAYELSSLRVRCIHVCDWCNWEF